MRNETRNRESILSAYAVRAEGFRKIAIKRAQYLGTPLEEQPPVRHETILSGITALSPISAHAPCPLDPRDVRVPSDRELEVLALLSVGLSNAEIGERLFICEETVKSHVRKVLLCLGARNRAHAVALGFHAGIIAAP